MRHIFSLEDLAKLDGRVEANIDGLRIAGEAGWEMCKDAIGAGGEGAFYHVTSRGNG
jgi:hypothetical protein